MATEKRLIDANALSEKIGNMKNEITHSCGGYRYCNEDEKNEWDKLDGFDSLVFEAPTVDAVEVVRCKDCRRWKYDAKKLCGFCDALICYRPDYFWCMYGERKTDNDIQ